MKALLQNHLATLGQKVSTSKHTLQEFIDAAVYLTQQVLDIENIDNAAFIDALDKIDVIGSMSQCYELIGALEILQRTTSEAVNRD